MANKEISTGSPIEKKIRWAEECFQARRDQLLKDSILADLLERFTKAVNSSRKAMKETGIERTCRLCEEKEGGSCCGAGLEDHYSGSLLLINLLLAKRLPKARYDPRGCLFLTATGCSLLARHVICVNYLCKKITDRIDPEKIADLREKEGIELEILFHLNERIKTVLNSQL